MVVESERVSFLEPHTENVTQDETKGNNQNDSSNSNERQPYRAGGHNGNGWKKGQSGNPRGMIPSGLSWKQLLEREGEQLSEIDDRFTRKEYLARRMYDHAEKGNAMILREVLQRMEPITDETKITVVFRDEVTRMGLDVSEVFKEFLRENKDSITSDIIIELLRDNRNIITPEMLAEFIEGESRVIDTPPLLSDGVDVELKTPD